MRVAPSSLFRTLADPTRLALFERLAAGDELSVTELTRRAKVSQPAVSQHLAALRVAGLVRERKAGRHVLYRARANGLKPVVDWINHYSSFWSDRFDALERELESENHE